MSRKQRKYGGGGKALGMSKHRESGYSGPSRRTKEWVTREINALAPRRYRARMYASIQELMRQR
jgi:hypothetical protein